MKIGLLHLADITWGRVYQYSLSVIEALRKDDAENQYIVISPESDHSNLPQEANIASPSPQGFLFSKV